uniref:Efflux pump FUB11 (Fusaric acid biosynthesis protein 11) n=1 Tax=Ganoderma boninense TaxID=34458 RepID=A0A5K1K8H5_9APHY|nr:Efflux pump FUB11 (Fusaric acid biosynthesis protein 11) [Ganoderma boninense]
MHELHRARTRPSQVFTARVPFNAHAYVRTKPGDMRAGSAVYVYGIIAPFWRTDLAFYLDGERAGTFALEANTSRAYEYDVVLFASGALPLAAHTLAIQSGTTATDDGSDTLVLLDRVVYTYVSSRFTCARARAPSWPDFARPCMCGRSHRPSPFPSLQARLGDTRD